MVVGTQPVTVGVVVAEQAALEHFIRGRADAGYEVAGRESGLLNFGKVVLRIAVEDHTSDIHGREIGMGPDFRDIEGVEPVILRLLRGHDLDFEAP